MFLFSADSGARPVPSELVLWCVVAFTKERSAWSSRTKMLNQSDWIISNCTSSLLLRELLLVPIGCSTLARLAAVHPSSAQPPPSPSLGPRSSATRSRKGLVVYKKCPIKSPETATKIGQNCLKLHEIAKIAKVAKIAKIATRNLTQFHPISFNFTQFCLIF